MFSINGIKDGVICDEGVCYEKNGQYFLHWVGLGVTRRISKKMYFDLYYSDLVIR